MPAHVTKAIWAQQLLVKDLNSAVGVKTIFLLTGMGMTAVAEGAAGVAEGDGVGVGAGARGAPLPLMMSTKL